MACVCGISRQAVHDRLKQCSVTWFAVRWLFIHRCRVYRLRDRLLLARRRRARGGPGFSRVHALSLRRWPIRTHRTHSTRASPTPNKGARSLPPTTDLHALGCGAQVLNTPNHTHPVSHSTAALQVLARLPRSRPTSHAQPSRPALTSFLPAICWLLTQQGGGGRCGGRLMG